MAKNPDKDNLAIMAKTTYNRNLKKAAVEERKRIVALIEALGRGYYGTAQGERYRASKEIIETIERNS